MKHLVTILCALTALSAAAAEKLIDAPPAQSAWLWPSTPPTNCPFPQSKTLAGIAFTGKHAEYTTADTWYPSWATDDNLYAPYTDGAVNGLGSGSGGENATTGHATIIGNDPLSLIFTNQGVFKSSPRPYEGRYPCGSLVHNGVWYYSTYCLHPSWNVPHEGISYNWPWLGPVVGFRWSTNYGQTWTQTPCTPEKPLFGEHALKGEPVKISAPHFVDFGKNMQYSPDGKAYLVAQGSSDGTNRRFAYNSWITADHTYLIRVTPSIETINDASQYEFFGGHDSAGKPVWTRDFSKIKPLVEWRDHMGCVTMTYNPGLKKYLLCVTDGGTTVSRYNTYILESDNITGPWSLVTHMNNFGEQAYFVNIPSKFIADDGNSLWLLYSANFSSGWGGITFQAKPRGSRYAACFQQVQFVRPGDPALTNPLNSLQNIARQAIITVSSTHNDYSLTGLTDGSVDGFPRSTDREWASKGEGNSALVRLNWTSPQTIDRVWLFDRPNDLDRVTSGLLIFSDGTTIKTGALPDDAKQGTEVTFEPKTVSWIIFAVDTVKPGALNIGLSELAVFTSNTK